MRRGERRDAGGPRPESPVPAGKASLEEPPDVPSAGRATGPGAGRRSTESEVYDDGAGPPPDGCDPGLALCRCSSVRRIKPST
uniref:Uncharacterized protein n=1 Tax=Theropithecus gelada TaxID=9565 RepID=A0A8D2FZ11_THEGE